MTLLTNLLMTLDDFLLLITNEQTMLSLESLSRLKIKIQIILNAWDIFLHATKILFRGLDFN